MLRGDYNERDGFPQIEASVFYDMHLAVVTLMFDTGATMTMLNAFDAEEIGIDAQSLQNRTMVAGAGGVSEIKTAAVQIVFEDDGKHRYAYEREVGILPTEVSRALPSVLGRDILNNWNIRLFPVEGLVEADVLHCDYSLENPNNENF